VFEELVESELILMALMLREPIIFQYTRERGFLLLSEKSKAKHSITKANITLYAYESECLGKERYKYPAPLSTLNPIVA
jgi:hypothetical protein